MTYRTDNAATIALADDILAAHYAQPQYRLTEVGNLYKGDTVLLPGDIFATVTGFDFTGLSNLPGQIIVDFDSFPSVLYRTTDEVYVEVTGVRS